MGDQSQGTKVASANRRALLEMMLREAGVAEPTARSAPRREPRQWAPLSFAQQRLWFLEQMEPGSYNVSRTMRLGGTLDVLALGRALTDLVRRHEVLRTVYSAVDGVPRQTSRSMEAIACPLIDLTSLDRPLREERAGQLSAEEVNRPFDLGKDLLLRAKLLRFDEDDHVLILVTHHIASDGWSRGILLRDLGDMYAAYSRNESPNLPELPIQYSDYAVWQRDWMQGKVLDDQLSYWRQQLAGAPQMLNLATDRHRPELQSNAGALATLLLPAALSERIRSLCSDMDSTLFMVLMAAFQVLLYRYTGQEDFLVGTPVANRNLSETEDLIGLFVNTLVFRARMAAGQTFLDLLANVKQAAIGAYSSSDLPFERLIEDLHPERSMSHSPLIQVLISVENSRRPADRMGDLTISTVGVEHDRSKFDLSLLVSEDTDGLTLRAEYSTALWDGETIYALLGHLQRLLEGIVTAPNSPVAYLPLLPDGELDRLLIECNQTATNYPNERRIHELFVEQVERSPNRAALVHQGTSLTYSQLNARANRLAHLLRERGAGPHTRVAVCIERSPEMVVALIGVLKAGAAYVPLDPSHPRDRLNMILHEARPVVILTQEELRADLPVGYENVVSLDGETGQQQYPPTEPCDMAAAPQDLAYVIFTSGSTGKPKGVEISHTAVVNFLWSMQSYLGLSACDVLLAVTTVSFDIAGLELFLPLMLGASVVVSPEWIAADGPALISTIAASGTTVMQATPATWRLLIASGWEGDSSLKILCGGEAFPADLAQSLMSRCAALWNVYGPTETTIWSTIHPIQRISSQVPIGRPIGNTQVYVLDRRNQVTPIGVPGELYIGGYGVARGYLAQPELTAEKFVPDHFSRIEGSRLYRTGDLVRWRADGTLDFLGRLDHQVKVRGFRIELGEVESALSDHPLVQAAVVTVREETTGDKRLVAYIVGLPGEAPTVAAMRSYLHERLPHYMIPAAFVWLDSLPLNPNGKVDRKALPAPEATNEAHSDCYIEPRSPMEVLVAQVWSELLHTALVGIGDNFFDLGGHSLLATQALSRLRELTRVDLKLRTLFENPTVEQFARAVLNSHETSGPDDGTLLCIPRSMRSGEVPLSFAQERIWFFDCFSPGAANYIRPVAVHLTGPLNVALLEQSFTALIARHESLRTTITSGDVDPVQVISPAWTMKVPVFDLRLLSNSERASEVELLAMKESSSPFILTEGPLLRASLLRLKDEEYRLVIALHHIIADGWSINILLGELGELYQAFVDGRPSLLRDLPVQFGDYAVWQREWLRNELLEENLEYWKAKLAGAPEVLNLPTDYPRPPIQTYSGGLESVLLPPELAREVESVCSAEGVTLYMAVLSAFSVLLSRYSGQETIVIGSPISGRNHPEIEGLIGLFVNTLAMRTDLCGDPTFREILARVRETVMEAFDHQDLPFEKLVEELNPERNMSHPPLVQAMLLLQNMPLLEETLGDIKMTVLEVNNGTAKVDISLALYAKGDTLRAGITYNTDLFTPETVRRMLAHFQVLLSAVAVNPNLRLSEIPLLTDTEQRQIIVDWNATETPYPDEMCLHQFFEQQVDLHPDAIAIDCSGVCLTYRKLNQHANRLAFYLRDRGVGPEVRVGICLERSPELIVGLLAILKAGGVYVPLDPAYPETRLSFLVSDSQVALLLTQRSLASRLMASGAHLVNIEEDSLWREESAENPPCITKTDNLAYVIYTSGSTGNPKGVMIAHRSVANLLTSMRHELNVRYGDVFPCLASHAFDMSVPELYLPLLSGGTLLLITRETSAMGTTLLAELTRGGATIVHATPTSWDMMLEADKDLRPWRTRVVGAEALSRELAGRLLLLDGELYNYYGPTETTVWSTFNRVASSAEASVLGGPLPNTCVYVVDNWGRLAPVGIAGELWIGGAGVSRGYWSQAGLTAEKFVPDPFSAKPGRRLYRTGDRVKWRSDGRLEFLGRADHQVKVRGFRIELGEIETVLSRHEDVREAVVVVREDVIGDKRLTAYYLAQSETVPSSEMLRSFVQVGLPAYMVPSAFIVLEAFPLTPNGKVDRKALPAPNTLNIERTSRFVAPRNPIEEMVAAIWMELLRLPDIGVTDNFFELGGHSLLTIRFIMRLRTECQVDLTLRTFFEDPTVAGVADTVAQSMFENTDADEMLLALMELSAE